jgi:hypothetical protein
MAPWRFYSRGRLIATVHLIWTEEAIRAVFPSAQVYADIRAVHLGRRPAIEVDARD